MNLPTGFHLDETGTDVDLLSYEMAPGVVSINTRGRWWADGYYMAQPQSAETYTGTDWRDRMFADACLCLLRKACTA